MDYYEILGVTKTSSYDEIKKKYRELAIQYHPDKNKNNDANEKFKKINEAYKTLSDPYNRGKYDSMLERGEYSNIKDNYGINFDYAIKMFNSMFQNDPFLRNMFNGSLFNLNEIPKNSKSYFTSYSSSIISSRDKDGKIITKQQINKDINGKSEKYYKEYYIDSKGNKVITKEEGNKNLKPGKEQNFENNKINNNLQKTYRLL